MGEVLLAAAVGLEPVLEDGTLDPAHGFLLGDARVGHPVEVTLEQRLLVPRSQVAICRDADVVVVRHEVEDVLLQVGPRAADAVHLFLANHLGQRYPEFGRTHGSGQGQEHFAPGGKVALVRLRSIPNYGGVEVSVVTPDEEADGAASVMSCGIRTPPPRTVSR